LKRSLLYNEDNLPATQLQVLQLKDNFEARPVSVFGKSFDVSLFIMKRFEMAIEFWDILPKYDDFLPWMLEDSSLHLFTNQDLLETYAEFKRKVALRSAQLHFKAMEILSSELTCKQANAEFQSIVDAIDA